MKMAIATVAFILGIVLGGSAGAQSLQQFVAQCSGNIDALVIQGCTGILRSAGISRKNLAVAYVTRGSAYTRQGDFDSAIADFTDAIRRNPSSLPAYYNRGNVYFAREEFDNAIADFNLAISLQPDHVLSYNNLGSAYLAKGEIDRAIAEFNRALAIDPNSTQAASNRALAYTKKGDVGGVIRNFGAVVKVFFRSIFARN